MKNNEVFSCAEMINKTFSNIEKSRLSSTNKVEDTWKKILTSIKTWEDGDKVGQNLYAHTSVVEIKNKILLVEADHPGWIQLLQVHKKYILNGLKMYVPELNICSLAFRLKGSNAMLSAVNYKSELEKENEKLKENLEKQDEILNSYSKMNEKKSDNNNLPENLKKIFEDMKSKESKK